MRVARRVSAGLLPALFLFLAIPAAADEPTWRDATRDIFIDGKLDRAA